MVCELPPLKLTEIGGGGREEPPPQPDTANWIIPRTVTTTPGKSQPADLISTSYDSVPSRTSSSQTVLFALFA
jgi:hypothetical protein